MNKQIIQNFVGIMQMERNIELISTTKRKNRIQVERYRGIREIMENTGTRRKIQDSTTTLILHFLNIDIITLVQYQKTYLLKMPNLTWTRRLHTEPNRRLI